jgi:two-component system chemotaxis response regulator CheY
MSRASSISPASPPRRNPLSAEPSGDGFAEEAPMKTCLVVDDSKVIRMVARRILEGLNFAISEAADGQKAFDACKQTMPDAILLDWNMPVMNGIEFLRALRKMPGGEAPIVVFCTTENEMTKIQEAILAGANEYIMKPFDSDIIQTKFAQVGLI